MVEGAALEMLCPERDLGFESLTLRLRYIAADDARIHECGYALFFYRLRLMVLGPQDYMLAGPSPFIA